MHASRRALIVHTLIRASIAIGFAAFIAYLVKNGQIALFIAPRMLLLVKLSAIVLYAIGAYQIYEAYRHIANRKAACSHCGHAPTGAVSKHIMIYGLFVFPLLLGILLPNSTMGSALAEKKGMNLNASASGRIIAPKNKETEMEVVKSSPVVIADSNLNEISLDERFVADEYNEDFARLAKELYPQEMIAVKEELFMEILTSIDLFMEQFQGKTIEIEGFVYREEDMDQNQFVVGRFAMDCCTADALPYGVLVEHNHAGRYENDSWLKIRAAIGKTAYQGNEIMMLKPISIERIDEPTSPYIYPNYDF